MVIRQITSRIRCGAEPFKLESSLDREETLADTLENDDSSGAYIPDDDEAATPSESDIVLELDGVSKSFGPEQAVDNISFSVRDGELLTLLGPSGCGKTTTLRLIAGLERPDSGSIRLRGDLVAGAAERHFVPPEGRDVGIVFQDFALFPHLTAAENIAFGLTGWSDERRRQRVEELLDMVDLPDQGGAYPSELSGGQRQRVALARALAPNPAVLLLDEPFSNLDVGLRVEMREEVRRILKQAGATAVSVTHDQEEAVSISDRIAVMQQGDIEQIGEPERVFQRPTSRFVAGFLGYASFIPGVVNDDRVETPLGPLDRERLYGLTSEYDRSHIDVMVRPDDLHVQPASASDGDGRVVYRRYLGPTVLYRVALDDDLVIEAMRNHAQSLSLDTPVAVDLVADHKLAWFPR